MKKLRKITATALIASMFILNTPLATAEWIHHTKLEHANRNPLLMNQLEKNVSKDKQLCKIASSFDILDENGVVIDTYYPQGCQEEINPENIFGNISNNEINPTDNNGDKDGVDDFIKNIFSEQSEKTNKIQPIIDIDNREELDDASSIIDDLFGNTDINATTTTIENTGSTDTNSYNEENSGDDDMDNTSTQENTESTDNSNDTDDADSILREIFNSSYNETKSIKASKYAKTLKNYKEKKLKIRVGAVEATVIKDDMVYATKVANLLNKIDKELKIDSIKNSLAKNISNVSYSLYTYQNTADSETKEVFRNKLINDFKKLKKKYKILKNKDAMISATLERRGQM